MAGGIVAVTSTNAMAIKEQTHVDVHLNAELVGSRAVSGAQK
jgi:hypothetical protein